MKKFGIIRQLQSELFIVILNFFLVKVAVNALHLCKLHKDCLTDISHGVTVLTNASIPAFSNGCLSSHAIAWL
jgi:hypothetical protein